MDQHSSSTPKNRSLEARRLDVPGTKIHREPLPATERQGRPLREPRPEGAGHQKAGDQKAGDQKAGDQKTGGQEGFEDNRPSYRVCSRELLSGEVPGGAGLSHTWLRQKNLFAELRALRDARKGKRLRNENLKVRLSPLQEKLLGEALAWSWYRDRSAYLRAAATGRDRLAPVVAKAGTLFFWARAHLGEKVSAGEWENLSNLLRPLFGTEQRSRTEGLREGLRLARRHLRAGQLHAKGKLLGEEGLPLPPEGTYQKPSGALEPAVSVRLSRARKQLIRENAAYSDYDSMSSYVRHMALGWDRNGEVLAQGAAIARWIEEHFGEELGPRQWKRLEDRFHERFGIFLFGAGPSGETDVEGALRRGVEHLLGATLETVAEEAPISL